VIQTQPQVAILSDQALLKKTHTSQIGHGRNLGVPNKNSTKQAT